MVVLQDNIWQYVARFLSFNFIGMRRCSKYFNLIFAPTKSKFMWQQAVNFDPIGLLDFDHITLQSINTIDSVFGLMANSKEEHVSGVFENACAKSRLDVIAWLINNADFTQLIIQDQMTLNIKKMDVVVCILESCKGFLPELDASAMRIALTMQQIPLLNWIHNNTSISKQYMLYFNEMCTSGLLLSAKWIARHCNITREYILN